MIYKDYSSKIEDLDEKGRVLVAANGIGNQDADGDISANGSFELTLKKDFPRLRWFLNHDKNILLGVPIEGKEDGEHLKMLGQLNMKKQVSRDIYEDYKLWADYGRTLEHSIGVKDIKRNDKNKNIVEQWELREYSTLTSWGANSNTPMLGIKEETLTLTAEETQQAIEKLNEEKDFAEYQLKKGNYSDEWCRKIERKLHDIIKLLGKAPNEEVLREPTTQEVHQVEQAAFDPAKLKAAADALALRTFIQKLNINDNG
jgi:HK97 family phage prohead protease